MPWSSSPRFSNGLTMYGLLVCHVFQGEGRFFDQVKLEAAHSAKITAAPPSGKMSQSNLKLPPRTLLPFQTVDRERPGVFLGLGRVECDAVEKCLRLRVEPAVLVAD